MNLSHEEINFSGSLMGDGIIDFPSSARRPSGCYSKIQPLVDEL